MIDFEALETRLTAHVTRRMIELASLRPGERALDVGCGRGQVGFACAEAGATVLGFDVDAEAVAVVNAREVPGVQAVVSAAETFTSERRFDAAFARWSLASTTQPVDAFASVAAVLEPDAPFVVATWASAEWWSIPREVIGRFASLPPFDSNAPGAMRFANVERLLELGLAQFQCDSVEQRETAVVEGAPELLLAWTEHVFGRWLALVPEGRAADCRGVILNEMNAVRSLRGMTHLVRFRRLGRAA